MTFDTNDPGENSVQQGDLDTPLSDLGAVYGDPVDSGGATLTDTTRDFLEVESTDLRLATGQVIEDGSGTERFDLNSSFTRVKGGDGGDAIILNDSFGYDIQPTADAPHRVKDKEGNFTAFQYTTSASAPGTLSLDNAQLQTEVTNGISVEDSGTTSRLRVSPGNASSSQSPQIKFRTQTAGTRVVLKAVSNTPELVATDGNGNQTTLT